MSADTCVGALLERSRASASAVALRFRHLGVWETTTWGQYGAAVETIAAGLALVGVGSGVRVGLLAENSPEWLVAFFAIQLCGAVPVVVSPALSAEAACDFLAGQSVFTVIAGDQEQFDKVEDARSGGLLSGVHHVVVIATRGMRFLDAKEFSDDDVVLAWSKVAAPSGPFVSVDLSSESVGAVFFDGEKAIELTHKQMWDAGQRVVASLGVSSKDECMALDSFADSTSLRHDVIAPVLSGMTVSMSPVPDLLLREIPEVRPTLVVAPSRILTWIYADASRRADLTKGPKRFAYRAGLRRGRRRSPKAHPAVSPLVVASVIVGLLAFVLASIPDSKQPLNRLGPSAILVLTFAAIAIAGGFTSCRSVRNLYGLGRIRSIVAYGEVLDPSVEQWFRAIGVPIEIGRVDDFSPVIPLIETVVAGS